jgi:isopentenyldiphosphate isomerase
MTIPIVDAQDNVIAHKNRASIGYANDIFRTASLWITNSNGDVLLAQRKLDKKVDPGKWAEAVSGTVENDNTYETIIREAEEE